MLIQTLIFRSLNVEKKSGFLRVHFFGTIFILIFNEKTILLFFIKTQKQILNSRIHGQNELNR